MRAALLACLLLALAAADAARAPPAPIHGDVFLTYGTGRFAGQRDRLAAEATATGAFANVVAGDAASIERGYANRHAAVLGAARGAGYWLWKPYMIHKLLSQAQDGDVVMYADAGSVFTGDPRPLLALARKHGFLGFRMPHMTQGWTKGDVYKALDMDINLYGRERQLSGAVLFFKKCPRTMDLVQRWLALCEREDLLTDVPSVAPNHAEFQDHRHDQSILTLLLLKHGVGLVLEDITYPREIATSIWVARLTD